MVREKNKRLLKPRLDDEIARFKAKRDSQLRSESDWNQQESGRWGDFGPGGWSISSSYKPMRDDTDD